MSLNLIKTKFLILFLFFSTAVFAQSSEKVKVHKWKDKNIKNPEGIWEFYDYDGKLEQKYDFTTNTLLFHTPSPLIDTATYKVTNGTEIILTKLDSPPVIIGGTSIYRNILIDFHYPAEAREKGITGDLVILITVDDQGKAIDYKIKKGLGAGMEEEGIRSLKLLPYGFAPGILNGKKVTTEYTALIKLRLN